MSYRSFNTVLISLADKYKIDLLVACNDGGDLLILPADKIGYVAFDSLVRIYFSLPEEVFDNDYEIQSSVEFARYIKEHLIKATSKSKNTFKAVRLSSKGVEILKEKVDSPLINTDNCEFDFRVVYLTILTNIYRIRYNDQTVTPKVVNRYEDGTYDVEFWGSKELNSVYCGQHLIEACESELDSCGGLIEIVPQCIHSTLFL